MRRSIIAVKGGFDVVVDGEKVGKTYKKVEEAIAALKAIFE
jgi:hypothetical protein